MPYHKKLINQFSDGSPIRIHLCGNASHHFKFLRENLNVQAFNTGFPIDFSKLRKELGPDVQIDGGPTIMLLRNGSKEEIQSEIKRICSSGIMNGGKFIMIAANNLAPCTPVENIAAMYEAGKEYGKY